jgi:ubiquinone/menaquinone biosynthesis C-methylase UbiE
MTIDQAAALLRTPCIEWARPQIWCDLGCGEGAFTVALASLLAPGSIIHGVDMDQRALRKVPETHDGVAIRTVLADISSLSLRLPCCDGVLMANSLHFIREQAQLLARLTAVSQRFLVVEYEQSRASVWEPYPVNFQKLCDLFHKVGTDAVHRINSRRSRFGGTMYSALAEVLIPDERKYG